MEGRLRKQWSSTTCNQSFSGDGDESLVEVLGSEDDANGRLRLSVEKKRSQC